MASWWRRPSRAPSAPLPTSLPMPQPQALRHGTRQVDPGTGGALRLERCAARETRREVCGTAWAHLRATASPSHLTIAEPRESGTPVSGDAAQDAGMLRQALPKMMVVGHSIDDSRDASGSLAYTPGSPPRTCGLRSAFMAYSPDGGAAWSRQTATRSSVSEQQGGGRANCSAHRHMVEVVSHQCLFFGPVCHRSPEPACNRTLRDAFPPRVRTCA